MRRSSAPEAFTLVMRVQGFGGVAPAIPPARCTSRSVSRRSEHRCRGADDDLRHRDGGDDEAKRGIGDQQRDEIDRDHHDVEHRGDAELGFSR